MLGGFATLNAPDIRDSKKLLLRHFPTPEQRQRALGTQLFRQNSLIFLGILVP
jgi:hypothetical protein